MSYQITSGVQQMTQKVVVYGPEGIGKTTFAAQFPSPLFIDTEGGSSHVDVRRLPVPTTWAMLLDEVRWVRDFPYECGGTLVLDTADWAERLCTAHVCADKGWSGIEDPGYGKGYAYVKEEFGRLLNALSEVCEHGLNVCVTAHAAIEKFEQPDEMGAYDRWGLKLLKKQTAPMLKEWADALLFANFRTIVVEDKNGRKKAQGGKDRVLYTTHSAAWDAKNRWGLPDEVPFEYRQIAPFVPVPSIAAPTAAQAPRQDPVETWAPPTAEETAAIEVPFSETEQDAAPEVVMEGGTTGGNAGPYADEPVPEKLPEHLRSLARTVAQTGLTRGQFVTAIARRTGYVTESTPFEALAPDLAAWAETVVPQIKQYVDAGMPAEVR